MQHWRWNRRLNEGEMSALSDAEFDSYVKWSSAEHSAAMKAEYAIAKTNSAAVPQIADDPDSWDIAPCGSYINSDWGR